MILVSSEELDVLKKKYKVDEFLYPKISMDIDLPGGLKSEVVSIKKTLSNNGFDVTPESIFQIMELKKRLLEGYLEPERTPELAQYKKIVLSKEPVGSIIPLDYYLVGGLVTLVLYAIGKFTGSFAEESGKLMAQRLFKQKTTQRKLSKKLDLTQEEYAFLVNEVIIILNDQKRMKELRKALKNRKSLHS